MSLPSADQLEAAGWTRLPDRYAPEGTVREALDRIEEHLDVAPFRREYPEQVTALRVLVNTGRQDLRDRPQSDPARYEYAEERTIEQVNKRAAQGWRVHTALLAPGSGMKVYLLERERP